jgi:hypothetical protein
MSKKSKDQSPVHTGSRSWWDGSVKTDCGQRIPKKHAHRVGMFERIGANHCPTCKNKKK